MMTFHYPFASLKKYKSLGSKTLAAPRKSEINNYNLRDDSRIYTNSDFVRNSLQLLSVLLSLSLSFVLNLFIDKKIGYTLNVPHKVIKGTK